MKLLIKPRKKATGIVAMSDISFLLLIFLITTVSLDTDEDLKLPSFLFASKAGYSETVYITVPREEGVVIIDDMKIPEQQTASELTRLAIPLETPVNIMADARVDYQRVDSLLKTLQKKELNNVILVVEQKSKEP